MSELLIVAGLVAGFGGAIAATVLSMRAVGPKGRRKALMRVPETTIAAVRDGEWVRLRGRAIPRGQLVTSPISQQPCIGFRVTIDPGVGDGFSTRRAIERWTFESFALNDGTGEAILSPPFTIELAPYTAGSQMLPPEVYALLEQEGVPLTDFLGRENHFVFAETVLLPDDEIIAVGRASVEVDPGSRPPSHREAPVVCQLKGNRHEPIVLADADDVAGTS